MINNKEIEYEVKKESGRLVRKKLRFNGKYFRQDEEFIEVGIPNGDGLLKVVRIPVERVLQIKDISAKDRKRGKYINPLAAF